MTDSGGHSIVFRVIKWTLRGYSVGSLFGSLSCNKAISPGVNANASIQLLNVSKLISKGIMG